MDQDLIDADKVVLGRRWFAMLDGELVTGDVNKHHELLLTDHEPVALLPNLEELRQAARRAELMLGAVAHPDAAVIARWAAGKDFDEQAPESYWDELLTDEERARLRAEYAADGGSGEAGLVLVEERNVYGSMKLYPANKLAQALADLIGTRTIPERDIEYIKALGLTVQTIGAEPRIL